MPRVVTMVVTMATVMAKMVTTNMMLLLTL